MIMKHNNSSRRHRCQYEQGYWVLAVDTKKVSKLSRPVHLPDADESVEIDPLATGKSFVERALITWCNVDMNAPSHQLLYQIDGLRSTAAVVFVHQRLLMYCRRNISDEGYCWDFFGCRRPRGNRVSSTIAYQHFVETRGR